MGRDGAGRERCLIASTSHRLAPAITAASKRFVVTSATTFRERERRRECSPLRLESELARRIYVACHLGLDEEPPVLGSSVRALEDHPFADGLSAANDSRCYDDPGWGVVACRDGRFRVLKDGLTLTVRGDDLRAERCPSEGALVAVRFPAERRYALPGFYLAIGSAGPPHDEFPLKRLYVHASSLRAATVLGAITRGLNGLGVRYQCKALNDPAQYVRPDAIVVYVELADFERAHAKVAASLDPRWLQPTTPGFASRLDSGIAHGDEPRQKAGRPISLGQDRSRLVARGLVAAWRADARDVDERGRLIAEEFASAGVDPSDPHRAEEGR